MALQIAIGNKSGVKVEGSYNGPKAEKIPFKFVLTCIRLGEQEYLDKVQNASSDSTVADFMIDVIEDWDKGVNTLLRDTESDVKNVPYSPDAFRVLCGIPGLARLCFDSYRSEVGVKAKN